MFSNVGPSHSATPLPVPEDDDHDHHSNGSRQAYQPKLTVSPFVVFVEREKDHEQTEIQRATREHALRDAINSSFMTTSKLVEDLQIRSAIQDLAVQQIDDDWYWTEVYSFHQEAAFLRDSGKNFPDTVWLSEEGILNIEHFSHFLDMSVYRVENNKAEILLVISGGLDNGKTIYEIYDARSVHKVRIGQ